MQKYRKIFICASALVSLMYFFGAAGVDPDLWGHLKFGRDIWESGEIPRHDPYSYTAAGRPWIDHEWLSELLMFGAFALGGAGGLITLRLGLGLLLAAILIKSALPELKSGLGLLVVFWLASPLIAQGFAVRPQMFSYVLAAAFLYLFSEAEEGDLRSLWVCVPLMALWTNLHGGFLMGLFLFAFYALLRVKIERNRKTRLIIFLMLVLLFLSTLINPYGIGLWRFLLSTIAGHRQISEWHPLGPEHIFFYRFTLLILVVAIPGAFIPPARRSPRYWIFLSLAVAAYLQQRHSPFAALAAVACGPLILEQAAARARAGFPRVFSPGIGRLVWWAAAAIATLQAVWVSATLVREGGRIPVNPAHYPVRAVEFMRANRVGGNLLTMFEWGEYCIFHLYPACRVSFDGRFETVYPGEVMRANWDFDLRGTRESAPKILAGYPTGLALLERAMWGYRYLERRRDWIKIFEDEGAGLFVSAAEPNRRLIAAFREGRLVAPPPRKDYFFP